MEPREEERTDPDTGGRRLKDNMRPYLNCNPFSSARPDPCLRRDEDLPGRQLFPYFFKVLLALQRQHLHVITATHFREGSAHGLGPLAGPNVTCSPSKQEQARQTSVIAE